MKIAIIGSRNLNVNNLDQYIPAECTEIVSGGAVGIDTCAAEYSKANGLILTEFLPDYEKYGRGAPIVRNKSIVEYSDEVLAFWDGESRGTKSVIDYCDKIKKPCTIITMERKENGDTVFTNYLRKADYCESDLFKKRIAEFFDENDFDIAKEEENYNEHKEELEKFLSAPKKTLPNARQKLLSMQKICEEYAKKHHMSINTEIDAKNYTAHINLIAPFIFFTNENLELLEKIKEDVSHITVFPIKHKLIIGINAKYFED